MSSSAATDIEGVDAARRQLILSRYHEHKRRFDAVAERCRATRARPATHPRLGRPAGDEALSPRETEVLQLVADGLPNREIARRLLLSEETVKSHMKHLLGKLQASSRAHAVTVGFRNGFIS
jgi:DNA-binding NarL/FixJ family response regulator